MTKRDPNLLIHIIFYIATFFTHAILAGPPAYPPLPDSQLATCALNFTEFPFQPTGECIHEHDEKVKYLNSISTTICCRDVLNALTKALARNKANNAANTGGIFLPQDQWTNCTDRFSNLTSVSPESCGFGGFHSGSGKKCSNLSIFGLLLNDRPKFTQAVEMCSDLKSSFNDKCNNCTGAISAAVDGMLVALQVSKDDKERALCTMGIVVSIVSGKINDHSWVEDFYGCLLSLQIFDDGYLKFKSSLVKAVSAIVVAIFVLLLILILIKYVARSKKKLRRPLDQYPREQNTWSGLYKFTKTEIENAINYGGERKILGRGSAGLVYKGVLPSGQVVAIKHIHKTTSRDSFEREVKGLSKVRHRHLACLMGCCIEGGDRYLVYEYCPGGNLAQHLLRKDKILTWETRVKILRECANALRYLHHHIDGCIVHRDIKLTNILLTENMEPKLSDFGLAKMLGIEESKVFTDVRGTIGYMDPEYMSNARLTSASDIYSFGIVILQVLSGQKVIDLDLEARDQLTRKAKDVCAGKRPLSDFEDPKLMGNFNAADFEAIMNIGVLCVSKSSEGRPLIDDVFEEMEKALKNIKVDQKKSRHEFNSSAMSMSRSIEVVSL